MGLPLDFSKPQFKQGLGDMFEDIGGLLGIGGKGNPNPHVQDDASYEDYYNSAVGDVMNSANGTKDMRDALQRSIQGQLAGLDNNAEGRKKNFEEDMARSFGNDMQSRARAAGGTGTLAQVLNPRGEMYDAQARQTARGYNDLYSQATNDIGKLTGMQGQLEGQDAQRANSLASLRMQRINQRTGVANQNVGNQIASEAVGDARRTGTLKGIVSGVTGLF